MANNNHLIIGLGGTGGKVIREFRKQYLQEYGDIKPRQGVFIDYLYLDSSRDDLDCHGWRVMGEDISLTQSQKINIEGESGLRTSVLQNFAQYPELRSFLTQDDVDKLSATSLIDGNKAGQRRKIGRLLLARHINEDGRGLRSKLKSTYQNLKIESGHEDVHFHLVAGLAGGTGSGTIVDVLSQIHAVFSDVKEKIKVTLYLYVPDLSHSGGKDFEFYQANGYAALTELNAISTGDYHPIDISAEVKRINPELPFDMGFLFTDTNDRGRVIDAFEGVPKMVASFLFYTLLGNSSENKSKSEEGGLKQLDRLVTSENIETDLDISKDGENNKRSCRFLSFGISKVEYPEAEIHEYLTLHHEEQAILALLNHDFTEDGFADISSAVAGIDLDAEVDKARQNLGLSEAALTLQIKSEIGEDSKNWQSFSTEWDRIQAGMMADAMEDSDSTTWMDYFLNGMEKIRKQGYRRVGIHNFFKSKEQYINAYSENIVSAIESSLMKRLTNGEIGLVRAEKYLEHLVACTIQWQNDFAVKQDSLHFIQEGEGNPDSIIKQGEDKEKEFNRMGSFRRAIGSHVSPFKEFCKLHGEYLAIETQIAGLKYGVKLLNAVHDKLLTAFNTLHRLNVALEEKRQNAIKEASNRCVAKGNTTEDRSKHFDAKTITTIKDRTIRNEQVQRTYMASIYEIIHTYSRNKFSNLERNLETISQEIERATTSHVKEIVENISKSDKSQPIVNVNILTLLKAELNTREKMKQFASELVESAACYVPFNNTQNGASVKELFHLSIPDSEIEGDTFVEELIEAIKGSLESYSNFSCSKSLKPNEIVFLSAKSGFPLRYIRNLPALRNSYDKLISDSDKGETNRFFLHSEVREYPALMDMDKADRQEKLLPYIIAALNMGIIVEATDRETETKIFKVILEDDGIPVSKKIGGRNYLELLRNLANEPQLLGEIATTTKKCLDQEYKAESKKEELRAKIGKFLREVILPLCDYDDLSDEYQKATQSVRELFATNLKLNNK